MRLLAMVLALVMVNGLFAGHAVFQASDDTWIEDGWSANGHRNSMTAETYSSGVKSQMLLRFDGVEGLNTLTNGQPVTYAHIVLDDYYVAVGSSDELKCYMVSAAPTVDDWDEDVVTWSNTVGGLTVAASEIYGWTAVTGYSIVPGDVDLDGDVDTADINIAIINYGTSNPGWRQGDVDQDGDVDDDDLDIIIDHFGESSPGITATRGTIGVTFMTNLWRNGAANNGVCLEAEYGKIIASTANVADPTRRPKLHVYW